MSNIARFAEQKARDSLAFDPLPTMPMLATTDTCIEVTVPFSERVSRILRLIPGAAYDPRRQLWQMPFSSVDDLRKVLPQIAASITDAQSDVAPNVQAKKIASRSVPEATLRQPRKAAVRPLRNAFLTEYGPVYPITLEAIGDDTAQKYRAFGFKPRQWVAQIMGQDQKGNWVREFMPGHRDYAKSNSIGSRGIMVTYCLRRGPIYEVSQPFSWRQTDRYFVLVAADGLTRLANGDVVKCLEN